MQHQIFISFGKLTEPKSLSTIFLFEKGQFQLNNAYIFEYQHFASAVKIDSYNWRHYKSWRWNLSLYSWSYERACGVKKKSEEE